MTMIGIKLYLSLDNKPRGPPGNDGRICVVAVCCAKHSQTTYLNSRSKMEDKVMKRLLMTAGLLITLCNVGAGIAYACKCYEDGKLACETTGTGICWRDDNGRCHCEDDIIIVIGDDELPVEGDGN